MYTDEAMYDGEDGPPKHWADPEVPENPFVSKEGCTGVTRRLCLINLMGNASIDEETVWPVETVKCHETLSTTDNVHGTFPFNTTHLDVYSNRDYNMTSRPSPLKTGSFGTCIGTTAVDSEATEVASVTNVAANPVLICPGVVTVILPAEDD